MSAENLSFSDGILSDKFGHLLEKIWNGFGKISTNLVSNSSPMTTVDKIGLVLTIVAFGVILSPIALSETDPYHIKGILEEVKGSFPLMEDFEDNQTSNQYTVIVHLKLSPEFFSDIAEKKILGEYRTFTS